MGGRRRHSATIEHPYETPAGAAAEFRLASGELVRLEPRDNCVIVGWTVEDTLKHLVAPLVSFADSATSVLIVREGHARTLQERGRDLAKKLLRSPVVQLLRIERPADAIVWEMDLDAGTAELSVVTPSWADAERLATEIGAREVGAQVLHLASKLG